MSKAALHRNPPARSAIRGWTPVTMQTRCGACAAPAPEESVQPNEGQEHVCEIIGQPRVGDTQVNLKGMLGKRSEHVAQRFGAGDHSHHLAPPAVCPAFLGALLTSGFWETQIVL